jgi:hypothetical protein
LGHDVSELPFGDTVSVENNPGRLDALRFKQRERQDKKKHNQTAAAAAAAAAAVASDFFARVLSSLQSNKGLTCLSFLFSSILRMRMCGQQQGVCTTTKQKQPRTQNRTKKRTRVER